MNRYIACFGLIIECAIALVAPNQGVLANTVVQVKANQVSGETAQLQTVKVWPGHGVSISFYRTREIIKKIWLDDPSRFVFDVDGCLSGLGRCSENNTGAGLIHIRQIEKVKIPGLPEGPYGAHMTVITESGSQRKTYHFRIVPGNGSPEYSELEIINDTASKPEEIVRPIDYTARSDSKYIAKGMQIARANQWVARDSKLWKRLNQLVELRSQGEELVVAASTAGVSMQLVEKLMSLGGKARLELPSPQGDRPPTTPTAAETDLISNQNFK